MYIIKCEICTLWSTLILDTDFNMNVLWCITAVTDSHYNQAAEHEVLQEVSGGSSKQLRCKNRAHQNADSLMWHQGVDPEMLLPTHQPKSALLRTEMELKPLSLHQHWQTLPSLNSWISLKACYAIQISKRHDHDAIV